MENAAAYGCAPQNGMESEHTAFRFIDLFAGIGGIRAGFDSIGGNCIFASEWNIYAQRTYKANFRDDP